MLKCIDGYQTRNRSKSKCIVNCRKCRGDLENDNTSSSSISSTATLYITNESNQRWDVIKISEYFKLDSVIDQIPWLKKPALGGMRYETAFYHGRLFAAGSLQFLGEDAPDSLGTALGSDQVHIINTLNPNPNPNPNRWVWETIQFKRQRCSPRLVVFMDHLYAFAGGPKHSDYLAPDAWAEVYDEDENVWKSVELIFSNKDRRGLMPLPIHVIGNALDSDGNLLLFSYRLLMKCVFMEHRKLRVQSLKQFQGPDIIRCAPVLIGHHLYMDDSGLKCYNLNKNETWSPVEFIDYDEEQVKADMILYQPTSTYKLITFGDEELLILQTSAQYNLITQSFLNDKLVCLRYRVNGADATYLDFSAIPIDCTDMRDPKLVQGHAYAFGVKSE